MSGMLLVDSSRHERERIGRFLCMSRGERAVWNSSRVSRASRHSGHFAQCIAAAQAAGLFVLQCCSV